MHRNIAVLIGAMTMVMSAAHAFDFGEMFTDPVDRRLDASTWLLSRHGFLPLPIIITEPAVGYGGGAALVFFHQNQDERAKRREFTPPSVSAAFAAATENGTSFGGMGHLGVWRHNTVRFTGGAGAASVNLKYYGGEDRPRLSDGIAYNIEGWGAFAQVVWRLGKTNVWLGPQLIYMDATTELRGSSSVPAAADLQGKVQNSGAGAVLTFDGRDNIFTPTHGLDSSLRVRQHWGDFIEDFDYTEIDGKNRWYFHPAPDWVLAWRLDGSFIIGEAPFYARPAIDQRGIDKSRYQGDAVVTTEFEARYALDPRWSAVTFVGVGRAADSTGDLNDEPSRWSGGVGGRYLIARLLGLQVGVDVARGPEEWAFYIQMGNGWSF
jgi:hypothetical protein